MATTNDPERTRAQRLKARVRYRFDRTMAAGPVVQVALLATVAMAAAVLAGLLIAFTHITQTGDRPLGIKEAVWESLMRTLDPGTMGADKGWTFRSVSLGVTLAGLLFVGALISILNNGLNGMLNRLRDGRSEVMERDHVVVLGWSKGVFAVLRQLDLAHLDTKLGGRVLILANRDPVVMQSEVESRVKCRARTLFIYRRGDPTSLRDLALAAPGKARSIIVLSPDEDDGDAYAVRTLLALRRSNIVRTKEHLTPPSEPALVRTDVARPVVAVELRKAETRATVQLIGNGKIQVVVGDELMARVIVQSSRQTGMSRVYDELLRFEDNEFYTPTISGIEGHRFEDIVHGCRTAAVVGYIDRNGAAHLSPLEADPKRRLGDFNRL